VHRMEGRWALPFFLMKSSPVLCTRQQTANRRVVKGKRPQSDSKPIYGSFTVLIRIEAQFTPPLTTTTYISSLYSHKQPKPPMKVKGNELRKHSNKDIAKKEGPAEKRENTHHQSFFYFLIPSSPFSCNRIL
jgi:hypothetical protein